MMQDKYNALGFYYDTDDPRLVVPKLNAAAGWTINLGHASGRIGLVAIAVVIGVGFLAAVLLD